MKLTKLEQETIILFNEAESTAEVYTHNSTLITKLEKLCKKDNDNYYKKQNTTPNTYIIPKKAVTFKSPRQLSTESRENKRINMVKVRESKKASVEG